MFWDALVVCDCSVLFAGGVRSSLLSLVRNNWPVDSLVGSGVRGVLFTFLSFMVRVCCRVVLWWLGGVRRVWVSPILLFG